ncbi:MAG: SprB repeat-containing protein [Bacteroidia bacterium]
MRNFIRRTFIAFFKNHRRNFPGWIFIALLAIPGLSLAQPSLSLSPSNFNGYNISCHGLTDGSIDLTITGGVAPFDILWSTTETSEDIFNLPAGNYTVRVIDANTDTAETSIDLVEPDSIQFSFTLQNETCGTSNGSITLNLTGGVQPYSYLWSTSATGAALFTIGAGTYTITVTDLNLCTDEDTASIINIPAPAATVFLKTDVNCFGGNNGSIDIDVSNGTPPFSFLWSNAETTEDISNLPAGSYTVMVTDFNLCTSSTSDVITQPDSIQVSFNSANEFCNLANGTIDAGVTGGVPPYSYLWSNSSTDNLISNLSAGTFTVTITDFNLCVNADASSIVNIPAPTATVILKTDVNCFGGNDGTIDVDVSNGTSPFSFLWSNGETTEDILNLTEGSYTITVTDFNLCTSSTGDLINQPDSMTIRFHISNASGGPNGNIGTTVRGGVSPYTFLWSTGATTDSIFGLYPGIYDVTITDFNSCVENRSATVQNASVACDVTVTSSVNVNCHGGNDGSVDISISGTFPPETYLWSNGETTQDIGSLIAGTYTVTVTDFISCVTSTSITITEPDSLDLSFTPTNETCGNTNGSITVNVSGGSIPYSYLWSGGETTATISNLSAGLTQ